MIGPLPSDASEGDIETQVVLPLLTRPEFLGVPLEHVRSKEGISARDIGKGTKRKIGYIPDYCVYKQSLPILIVEAKSPAKNIAQAYSEAALYALEINRSFPHKLNPCCRIFATDGITLLAGKWDAAPDVKVSIREIKPATASLEQLVALMGNSELCA